MNRGKYIVFETCNGIEFPILFPAFIQHSDISQAIKQQFKSIPISAGQFEVIHRRNGIAVAAYGNSLTLDISSRGKGDSSLIEKVICDPNDLSHG